jgi:ABC-type lipoprotein export system ATPase subunit
LSKALLEASGIHKGYRLGPTVVQVLRGANLTVRDGEFLAIAGASGSGKSTLLHILGALDAPDSGQVRFDGAPIELKNAKQADRFRCESVGFVFQFYHLLPELNLMENVLMPCMVRYSPRQWRRRAKRESTENADRIVEIMGLRDRIKHRPNELSGGERQRVAVARALVNNPRVLLADEPTGNLDSVTGCGILDAIEKLNQAGQTIVMVTHDPLVAERAHRVVRLHEGRIQADG